MRTASTARSWGHGVKDDDSGITLTFTSNGNNGRLIPVGLDDDDDNDGSVVCSTSDSTLIITSSEGGEITFTYSNQCGWKHADFERRNHDR